MHLNFNLFSHRKGTKIFAYIQIYKKNSAYICTIEKNIVLLQTNYVYTPFCGISTSVVHRLPKPRRRVRFPYAALSSQFACRKEIAMRRNEFRNIRS